METATRAIHHEVALTGVNNIRTELTRLQDNRMATFVSIESYLAWIPDQQLIHIFEQIGLILRDNFKTFRISFSFQRFRQLPVLPIPSRALEKLLESSPQLETLTLDECRFVFRHGSGGGGGGESDNDNMIDDVERLSLALQSASHLKHITLFNCFPHLRENDHDQDHQGRVDDDVENGIHHNEDPHQNHHHQQQQQQQQDMEEDDDDNINETDVPRRHLRRRRLTSSLLVSPDPLAHGLSQIPSLQELNLIFTMEGSGDWIQSLLRKSCSSNTLKILRINVPDRSCLGDPFQCMCRSLETNSTLRELSVRCPLDDRGGIALARALASPTNALEEIYIQMKSYHYAVPIALALKNNQHLRSFELRVWTGGDRTPLLRAYEQILPQHNMTLEQLIIDNGRHGLTPLCDFYLSLNRNGRKQLLEIKKENSREVESSSGVLGGGGVENLNAATLISFWFRVPTYPSDVSVLFYTLSLNPGLITTTSTETIKVDNDDQPLQKKQKVQAS